MSSNSASRNKVDHPDQRLLKFDKNQGAPFKMVTKPWFQDHISAALVQGGHRLCMEHPEFLHEEVHNIILKSQWVVLPAVEITHLSGFHISPCGVVPQQD